MTKAQRHLARVRAVGCLICQNFGLGETPASAHHIGDSSDRSDYLTIPLCKEHHQGATGFHGLGERAFNARYSTTELQLLGELIERLSK